MNDRTVTLYIKTLAGYDDLPSRWQNLYTQAQAAAKNAYAPYSKFLVGAALLLDDQTLVTGNNQENLAYPSGLCAERVAVFSASANYPNKPITHIAIAAMQNDAFIAVSPCGACRQVLLEYEMKQNSPIEMLIPADNGTFALVSSVATLLPLHFKAQL